ncbi:Mannose-binding lectin [Penicillium griseofulvum]|uniref:Mannose-binding lectin n=1 Tax=Penicillium patulum TaxID=5078 RepID=A0A135LPX8_PENPA|nr:Mannose-binding lectin [Penicillium griseofulvum]KXG50959.1 Mannose-binding lectin [Penicillium griseofulvum]
MGNGNPRAPGGPGEIRNPRTGGDPAGKKAFELLHGSSEVDKIRVWIGNGKPPNPKELILALQLVYVDHSESEVVGKKNHDDYIREEFDLNAKEVITEMSLYTGWRFDRFLIKSFDTGTGNSREWKGGAKDGGNPHEQKVGEKVLLGFWGYHDDDEIVQIGSIFRGDS